MFSGEAANTHCIVDRGLNPRNTTLEAIILTITPCMQLSALQCYQAMIINKIYMYMYIKVNQHSVTCIGLFTTTSPGADPGFQVRGYFV